MANGMAQARHHHTHGRAGTEDICRKIEGRLVSIGLREMVTTDGRPLTTTGRLHRHLRDNEARLGAMEPVDGTPTSHHDLVMALQTYLATAPMAVTVVAEVVPLLAMCTFPATTTAHDDHVNRTTDNDEALEIPATPEMAITMIGQIAVEPTETEIESDQVIRETLREIGGTAERDPGVRSAEIGTATIATTTSIGGARGAQ